MQVSMASCKYARVAFPTAVIIGSGAMDQDFCRMNGIFAPRRREKCIGNLQREFARQMLHGGFSSQGMEIWGSEQI